MSRQPPAIRCVPTGNTYDKYGSTNPVVKRLMARFERDMFELLDQATPASILDVGCGEGVLTEQWADRTPGRVVGIDLEDPKLRSEWERRDAPEPRVPRRRRPHAPVCGRRVRGCDRDGGARARARPGRRAGGDVQVASRWVLVSVPREPLWRGLNMARGAYLRDLGNTPGHLNHWSKRSFATLLGHHGEIVELRSPFPWTMALVRAGA